MAERSTNAALHADLFALFAQLSQFGATPRGGLSRVAANAADGQARDAFRDWMTTRGFDVLVDAVGNMFGVLDLGAGADAHVFCGSHLDSQPDGGRFDGTLGVVFAAMAALELREAVARGDLVPACRYLVVVNWTNEEGARFQPSTMGSGVFTGALRAEDALATRDADGVTLRAALDGIGYLGTDTAPRPARYLELHIEQGGRLEQAGRSVGLVETCWGARKLRIEVTGRPDHTGPTPMELRRDAVLGAAHVVLRTRAIADAAPGRAHSSVGRIAITPNSPNTVAERAEMWVEFRAGCEALLDDMEAQLAAAFPEIAETTGCALRRIAHEARPVAPFDASALERIAPALDDAGIAHMRLPTIAGHDAVRLQKICPATLIFVPSRDGISHTPEEFTSDTDIATGFDALLLSLRALIADPSRK